MSIASLVDQTCQKYSQRVCVVEGDQQLTYGQMQERANRLARALIEMGVKPGDRVGIFQINCFQFVEMFYAIAKVGAIFVSLNFRLRGQETSYILNNAEAKVLILGDRYAELVQSIRGQLPQVKNYLCIGQPVAIIGMRAMMGIGAATIMPATLSILTATFREPKERAQAIALWAAVFALGMGIGPLVGGWLLDNFHWSSVFYINIPVVAVGLIGGYYFIENSKTENPRQIDIPGALLSIGGFFALVYAIIQAGHGWLDGNPCPLCLRCRGSYFWPLSSSGN